MCVSIAKEKTPSNGRKRRKKETWMKNNLNIFFTIALQEIDFNWEYENITVSGQTFSARNDIAKQNFRRQNKKRAPPKDNKS